MVSALVFTKNLRDGTIEQIFRQSTKYTDQHSTEEFLPQIGRGEK
jgi:hypothetical protein